MCHCSALITPWLLVLKLPAMFPLPSLSPHGSEMDVGCRLNQPTNLRNKHIMLQKQWLPCISHSTEFKHPDVFHRSWLLSSVFYGAAMNTYRCFHFVHFACLCACVVCEWVSCCVRIRVSSLKMSTLQLIRDWTYMENLFHSLNIFQVVDFLERTLARCGQFLLKFPSERWRQEKHVASNMLSCWFSASKKVPAVNT